MADYHCYPLWEASPGVVGNIDPVTLPIHKGLIDRLNAWANDYDATLNLDDPMASGFASEQAKSEFASRAGLLVADLQNELGPEYVVKAYG
ncbi:hypothetical protein [Dyella tabacisoli]|uniref:Uncharacterized protein n=2 Tax=Dyella tabacisoli TaxID=2282381 RepID=A0A369UJM0_9GAMM|nr:hypothetical protein DVJ77_20605 [Dyella tabacisoli]